MEDFNALAGALGADVEGVRACLILSRDGLVMGAYPDDAETAAKPAWLKLANLGDPERGFLQFGTETWCYVRRGPYAAFVVAAAGLRPGLVIDQMERVLLAAEEARADRGALKVEAAPAPASAPASKPRTPLHREPKPDDAPIVIEHAEVAATSAPAAESAGSAAPEPAAATDETTAESPQQPESEPPHEGDPAAQRSPAPSMWATGSDEDDVDHFSLSREFGQLLQDDETGADG